MICSKQGIEAATRLHSFYQQAGGDLLDADGKPTINSDAGRAALEFMTALVFEDKSAPGGRARAARHAGPWLEGKLAHGAGLAVPLLAQQGAARRQVRDRHRARASPTPAAPSTRGALPARAAPRTPTAPIEFIKWATSTDMLYAFGKEWLNPVPRASAIDLIAGRCQRSATTTRRRSPPSPPPRRPARA